MNIQIILIRFNSNITLTKKLNENVDIKRKFFLTKKILLAVQGFHYCVGAFSSCGEWGLLFVVVCGLFISVAYRVAEHRL